MPPTCSVCQHPERADIEADLRASIPYRDISRRQDLSKDARGFVQELMMLNLTLPSSRQS
jgi:hypothetical protein